MKKFLFAACFALAACGAPQPAPAPEQPPAATATLEIRDGWAPVTPGGVDVAAGYVTLANGTATDDRLVSVASPRASRVEIHTMEMDGDVMRMRQAPDGVAVPARGEATLAPGGTHLMFFGVTQPFVAGEEIPVQLTFEHAGVVETTLTVRGN